MSRDTSSRDVIRLADGRAVVVPSGAVFSTRAMLDLEQRAMSCYLDGRHAGAGVVPAAVLERVLHDERFARLSDEQRAFVSELTTSGHTVQGGVGRAGSGKTTALEAAVVAWRAAGYEVIGAAVGGTQAVVLGEEATGEARTVASVITRYFEAGDTSLITDHTVLLVDEASTLSTRDAALLERAVADHPGAALRLIGDPEQHTSVAAGGFFRWMVEEHAADVPQLATLYRQQGEEMAEVRLALDEYREGKITEAIERLERDGRITEAATAAEAVDLLTCAWYAERQRRLDDPNRRPSSMTAEHHHERAALNRAARALLKADGTLSGRELVIDGVGFQVNDEVIARVGDHELKAHGTSRDRWVRNGSRGVVREVGDEHLVVEFERWGRVEIPRSYIEQEPVPGVRGGLMHSYALTTFAAQGATMAAAMPLVTDASSREGTYVALTRPQLDLSAVAIRYDRLDSRSVDDGLPRAVEVQSDLVATARALEHDGRERLASQLDPEAGRVSELASSMRLDALAEGLAEDSPERDVLERALRERIRRVLLQAVAEPALDVVDHLGERPSDPDHRRAWDDAVGAIAVYREREQVTPATNGTGLEWALGPAPSDPDSRDDYDRFAAMIEALGSRRLPEHDPASFPGDEAPVDSEVRPHADLSDKALTECVRRLRGRVWNEDAHLKSLNHRVGRLTQAQDRRFAAGEEFSELVEGIGDAHIDYAATDARRSELVGALDALESEAAWRGFVVEDRPFRFINSSSGRDDSERYEMGVEPELAQQRGPELGL